MQVVDVPHAIARVSQMHQLLNALTGTDYRSTLYGSFAQYLLYELRLFSE